MADASVDIKYSHEVQSRIVPDYRMVLPELESSKILFRRTLLGAFPA